MNYEQEPQGGSSNIREDIWGCGGCLLSLLLVGLLVWALATGLDRVGG